MSASSRKATTSSMEVDNAAFAQAVDRVSTLSSDKGRAVKLTITDGKLDAFGQQSRQRQRDRGAPGRLRLRSARDRLQRPLSARHLGAARKRHGGVPARRSGLAHHGARRQGCVRPLRAHADAGMRAAPERAGARSQSRRRARSSRRGAALRRRAEAHRFPQLCAAPARARRSGRWCWSATTARARPICSRRCRCSARVMACAPVPMASSAARTARAALPSPPRSCRAQGEVEIGTGLARWHA